MSRKGQKIGSDSKSTMSNGKAGAAPATSTTSGAPPANAWSQPLRPKPSVAGPPPGMGKSNKNQAGSNSGGGGGGANQNALRERFISLSLNMVGQKVVVTQTNGAVFEGIFHTFSPFNSVPADIKNKYVIKACRVIKPPDDGSETNQAVDQSTVIIGTEKVACLTVKSMRIDTMANSNTNGSSQTRNADQFRTDTEISGAKGGRNKDLVAAGSAWTSGGGGGGGGNSRADGLLGGLEDKDSKGGRGGAGGRKPFGAQNANTGGGLSGNIGGWDQFQANKELFNINSTYDELLYTTELDKTQIDNRKIAEAERLAREIENTTSTNIHVQEERGHISMQDYDEEARYSSVMTKDAVKAILPPKSKADMMNEKAKNDNQKSLAPKKVMNYAAAAAKADPAKKSGPPGFSASKEEKESTAETESKPKAEETTEPAKESAEEPQAPKDETPEAPEAPQEEAKINEESTAKPEVPELKAEEAPTETKAAPEPPKPEKEAAPATKKDDGKAEEKPPADASEKSAAKSSSKLNANAKEFTLNATAKVFTPGGSAPVAPAAPEGHFVDPNAAMQQVPHMPGPHYVPGAPMVHQPGMVPMMGAPQFRYAAGGYGMDQQQHGVPQMQPQPQHAPPAHGSGAPSPGPGSGDETATAQASQEGDAAAAAAAAAPAAPLPQQPQQPGQPPQAQVPVPFGVPPGPYYAPGPGQMMHPRGPGAPHPGYHHPQFVGGHQQMVGPAGAPYRHMYPMNPGGMAPNIQVRGPAGPYYAAGPVPVPYPPNAYGGQHMMDEDPSFRGGQGRGRSGRGGRRGGRGGRGRGRYNNAYHQHGGRYQGQNQNGPSPGPSESWSAPDSGTSQGDGGMPGPSGPNQSGKPGDKSAKQ